MPALNWKAFQLLCRWRRWCICWRQWAWRSCCWRCWTWWGEDHVEDCASLTGCGRKSFLQVVQLLRSHQTIFEGSFPNSNFDWFIIPGLKLPVSLCWPWLQSKCDSWLRLGKRQPQHQQSGEKLTSWHFVVSLYAYLLITGRQEKWRRREIKQELTLSSLSLTSVISTSSLDWDLRSLQPSSSLLSFGEASSFLWKITWIHKSVEIIKTGSKCITLNQIQ